MTISDIVKEADGKTWNHLNGDWDLSVKQKAAALGVTLVSKGLTKERLETWMTTVVELCTFDDEKTRFYRNVFAYETGQENLCSSCQLQQLRDKLSWRLQGAAEDQIRSPDLVHSSAALNKLYCVGVVTNAKGRRRPIGWLAMVLDFLGVGIRNDTFDHDMAALRLVQSLYLCRLLPGSSCEEVAKKVVCKHFPGECGNYFLHAYGLSD